MAKKKRKLAQPPESPVARFLRKQRKWGRRLGIMAGLLAVAGALWLIADPLAGCPSVVNANGEEVCTGVVEGQANAAARTGSPAPNFVLADYDGLAVQLDQFEGKAVFVNFWASWCGPCEREMPFIQDMADQFPDDLVVLAVNRGESDGTAKGWTRSRNFREDQPNFYWLLDGRERVFREYQRGSGMPQSYFIDRNGIIRETVNRGLEFEEMLVAVEQALNASAPTTQRN